MAEIGFFHPDRGYWQAIDVSREPYLVEVEPERVEVDDDGNETTIPAVTRETSQLAELLATYPEGTVEVAVKPAGDYELQDGEWVQVAVPEEIPDRVSARQFKLQMLVPIEPVYPDGIIDMVEAWVAQQSRAVQISYADSQEFDRNEPMMQQGFIELGFNPAQIDAFFLAASKIGR
jgi:type IV secretory pathway ATPase VirB11/archaellum biosynthesis ATPase